MTGTPENQSDMLAGDQAAMRRLDTELMEQGQYVLPGVRRFVSTVVKRYSRHCRCPT